MGWAEVVRLDRKNDKNQSSARKLFWQVLSHATNKFLSFMKQNRVAPISEI
jgi:hypothetical protein